MAFWQMSSSVGLTVVRVERSGRGVSVSTRDEDRLGGRSGERGLAGEHLVHHAAERVDVAARVEMAVGCTLLRTHVGGRAQREPVSSGARPGVHGSGDAEVGEHTSLALQQDVLRLDVAMDDALTLGVSERIGDRPGDPQCVRQRELGSRAKPLRSDSPST